MVKNDIIEIQITAVSTDGSGIGKTEENLAVFVPGAAIGDELSVKIIKITKNYAVGKIMEIIEEGEGRVSPACSVCLQCGGCNFWHIDYETELLYKHRFVSDNVKRIGHSQAEIKPTEPSPKKTEYRNKVIYPVRNGKDGKPAFGFFAERSHRLIEVENCLTQPAIFPNIAKYVISFMIENKIPAYSEETNGGIIRNIFLRRADKGEVMVCIVATGPFKEKEALAKSLSEKFPEISTVVMNYNPKNTNVVLGFRYETLIGNGFIEDELCSLRFRISPASFYQINRDQAERLYNKAKELINPKGNEVLLDLYCGTGTIGLSMHKSVSQVIGVEIVPEAVENARENADLNGIKNAEFICADAAKGAKILRERGIKPDIIVVDPPRKGCTLDCLEVINSLSPSKICYISCNSATLARDMEILEGFGYEANEVYPFDMFPKTAHVECLTLLTRK